MARKGQWTRLWTYKEGLSELKSMSKERGSQYYVRKMIVRRPDLPMGRYISIREMLDKKEKSTYGLFRRR